MLKDDNWDYINRISSKNLLNDLDTPMYNLVQVLFLAIILCWDEWKTNNANFMELYALPESNRFEC